MRFTALIISLLLTHASYAELTVFDVRRNLPLSDSEKVYHDYLVDSGTEAGLKAGMVLTIQRRLPVYDYYRFKSVGDLHLKVAKVSVILVQDGLSVVRLKEDIGREDQAILEDNYVMIGDRLDMGTVVAEADRPAASSVVVTLPTGPGSIVAAPQIVVNSVDLTVPGDAPAPTAAVPAPAPGVVADPDPKRKPATSLPTPALK